jgi:TldD protein
MTNPATTSLLDRANLDRDAVRREITRGLAGADDGELFLEYGQTEALGFDSTVTRIRWTRRGSRPR